MRAGDKQAAKEALASALQDQKKQRSSSTKSFEAKGAMDIYSTSTRSSDNFLDVMHPKWSKGPRQKRCASQDQSIGEIDTHQVRKVHDCHVVDMADIR